MKLTIYVPDALGEALQNSDLNVSRVCRDALEVALEQHPLAKGGNYPYTGDNAK